MATFSTGKRAAELRARVLDWDAPTNIGRIRADRIRAGAVETVRSRCAAAARLAMRGEMYSPDDRADVAAELLARLYAETPTPAGLPFELASMTRLIGMASNMRRTLDRDRARDAQDCADRAAAAFSPGLAHLQEQERAETGPDAAHGRARDMLSALGLPRLGRAYPVAYTAARSAQGVELETVAAEMGARDADALRLKAWRAVKAIPSLQTHTRTAHADLLGLTAEREGATHAAPLEAPERYALETAAPVKVRRLPGGRRVWDGKTRASWTEHLTETQRTRLRTAALITRERVARRAAAEHAELRAAAE